MALAHGGVSRDEMAENLGVTPSTLSRWMGDKGAAPSRAYIAQWALATGVSRAWLEHGHDGPSGGGKVSGTPGYVGNLAPLRAA